MTASANSAVGRNTGSGVEGAAAVAATDEEEEEVEEETPGGNGEGVVDARRLEINHVTVTIFQY